TSSKPENRTMKAPQRKVFNTDTPQGQGGYRSTARAEDKKACAGDNSPAQARSTDASFYWAELDGVASKTTLPTVSSRPLNPSSTLRVSVLTRNWHCPVSFNVMIPRKLESSAQTVLDVSVR